MKYGVLLLLFSNIIDDVGISGLESYVKRVIVYTIHAKPNNY